MKRDESMRATRPTSQARQHRCRLACGQPWYGGRGQALLHQSCQRRSSRWNPLACDRAGACVHARAVAVEPHSGCLEMVGYRHLITCAESRSAIGEERARHSSAFVQMDRGDCKRFARLLSLYSTRARSNDLSNFQLVFALPAV